MLTDLMVWCLEVHVNERMRDLKSEGRVSDVRGGETWDDDLGERGREG